MLTGESSLTRSTVPCGKSISLPSVAAVMPPPPMTAPSTAPFTPPRIPPRIAPAPAAVEDCLCALRYLAALFVVTGENLGISFAAQNHGEFPRQVVTVLDAGIHSLRPHRGMNMRGITGEKTAAGAELAYATRVDLVSRKPVDLVDV